jgi:hypothetical protein
MTLLALPSTFRAESFSMQLLTNERAFASPYGGSEQVIDMLNDRWSITMTLPRGTQEDAARNEAFVNALRGMTNTCLLWHMKRRIPLGTMRGAPTAQAAAAGAGGLVINTTAGATLVAGDMIGVAGLLCQVFEDATANGAGVMAVNLANRRAAHVVRSDAGGVGQTDGPVPTLVEARSFSSCPAMRRECRWTSSRPSHEGALGSSPRGSGRARADHHSTGLSLVSRGHPSH